MSTIVGVESSGAVALAADRSSVSDSTVGGSVDRVFEFEDAGAAAVGDPGDVAAFGRRLGSELDRDRIERDRAPGVERLARLASAVAAEEGVEALVAARDDDGAARLRSIDANGGVLADTVAASGTGAQLALGVLEESSFDDDPDGLEERLPEILATVAERDPETGDEFDIWSLSGET